MKFEHQISEGTYHTQGLRENDPIVFIVICKTLNLERKSPKAGTMR